MLSCSWNWNTIKHQVVPMLQYWHDYSIKVDKQNRNLSQNYKQNFTSVPGDNRIQTDDIWRWTHDKYLRNWIDAVSNLLNS